MESNIGSLQATLSRLRALPQRTRPWNSATCWPSRASPEPWSRPATAKVTAEVLGEGRGDKILVFHLKRKKQYKKLQGHRQNFTEMRIKAIEADGVTYTAAS